MSFPFLQSRLNLGWYDKNVNHICVRQLYTWPVICTPAICGVIRTPGKVHKGLSEGKGSTVKTSSIAPPSHPSLAKQTTNIPVQSYKTLAPNHFNAL